MLALHRAIQERLVSTLPKGEVVLEKPIGAHRADVLWEKEKIVFEIQCSPLSLEDAVARSRSYQEKGFALVWILHTKTFNRKRLTSTEIFLRTLPCYYTAMTSRTVLGFYDQVEVIKEMRRVFTSKPLSIDFTKPLRNPNLSFMGDRFNQEIEVQKALAYVKKYFTSKSLFSYGKSLYRKAILSLLKKLALRD
jgi:hypothetical protein